MVLAPESTYLPEMATGTVMWNVRGGLYVAVDLYASSAAAERATDPHNALVDQSRLSWQIAGAHRASREEGAG